MRAIVPGADAALANSAGAEANLRQGPLRLGALYELLPFDNERVAIALSGTSYEDMMTANIQVRGSMVVLSGIRTSARCGGGHIFGDPTPPSAQRWSTTTRCSRW